MSLPSPTLLSYTGRHPVNSLEPIMSCDAHSSPGRQEKPGLLFTPGRENRMAGKRGVYLGPSSPVTNGEAETHCKAHPCKASPEPGCNDSKQAHFQDNLLLPRSLSSSAHTRKPSKCPGRAPTDLSAASSPEGHGRQVCRFRHG